MEFGGKTGNMGFGKILALLVILLVAVSSVYISYTLFFSSEGETRFYFSIFSDLPDTMESLQRLGRHPGYSGFQNKVTTLHAGEQYNLMINLHSTQSDTRQYTIIIESDIYSRGFLLSLEPGHTQTLNISISPTEEDKWLLESVVNNTRYERIDFFNGSFLGERIVPNMYTASEEGVPKDILYVYAPIRDNVPGLGNIMNINLSLKTLEEKPYRKFFSTVQVDETGETKKNHTTQTELKIEGSQLVYESHQSVIQYGQKIREMRIYLFEDDVIQAEKTLGFKYIVS